MRKSKILFFIVIGALVFASCNQVRQPSTEIVEFDESATINQTGAFYETLTVTDNEVRSEFEDALGDSESEDVIGISSIEINSIKLRFDVKADNETNTVNVSGTLTNGSYSGNLFSEANYLINRTGMFEYPVASLNGEAVQKIKSFCIGLYNEDGEPQDLDPLVFNIQGAPAEDPSSKISMDIYIVVVVQTGVEFCITVPPFMGGDPCGEFGIYWPFPF